ncbi:MAG: hypothetical protein P1S60_08645 [Anaerolineae bacterium]|nr:hypothetical protein [Anaerolineae bacterium]
MYWRPNIAVAETPQTRVMVPADKAYSFGYGGQGLDVDFSVLLEQGMDVDACVGNMV